MQLFMPIRQTILIVDDAATNLRLLSGLLSESYRVQVANTGKKGLLLARQHKPDLILLDVMMPGMDGYEVCRLLKQDPDVADIPVIFLTGRSEIEDEQTGLMLGAVDYITRPIAPAILRSRIKAQLAVKSSIDTLRQINDYLDVAVSHRTLELNSIKDAVVMAMSSLAEVRDVDTGNHLIRTKLYMRLLADKLKGHARFDAFLTEHNISLVSKLAPLHDIGKVGIPDRILLKPGRYEPQEMEIMKSHPALGRDAIVHAEELLGARISFLDLAKDIVYYHHEKWDGSGYPEGLSGDDIPIAARMMAVADVYDALICRRVYKAPMPHEAACKIMLDGRGKHFDPDVLDVFLAHHEDFYAIALSYVDEDDVLQAKADFAERAKG
ncbi:two-component system response regulator [Ferriphaselus sp. R-1]|uniref:response regulator n=1 Tax=Ferriphaselus sp. R-1 TaxID=1485544 RepID=UPI000555411F|nr:two-component system response regulator [Ferriphaselus sp. R-1]